MEKLAEKISDSELEVMRVLWEAEEPLPISDIRLTLRQRKGWEPTTTKTLVQRLCRKQAVAQEKRNVFYYRPLISQEEYQAWATNDLIHRLYRGSARNLVAALVHSDRLSNEDLQELKDYFKVEDET
ncbi:MAG: BlaI/MecI/CopY family transcriptional regulator [Candidatus Limivicinus sp.]